MTIIYNKNKILLAIALLLLSWYYLPKLYKAVTYHKANGIYYTHEYEERPLGEHHEALFIPTIRFSLNGKYYYFTGGDYISEVSRIGDELPVMYDPRDPSKAYVNTFLGYWGPPLIYIFPILVAIAGIILAIEMRIAAEKNRQVEDSGITLKVE